MSIVLIAGVLGGAVGLGALAALVCRGRCWWCDKGAPRICGKCVTDRLRNAYQLGGDEARAKAARRVMP